MKHHGLRSYFIVVLVCLFWQPYGFAAQTQYVTDRIMLGVHQEAETNSTLLTSIPSGTAVKVLSTKGEFSKVQLSNSTIGWVLSSYLLQQKPASAELDDLTTKYEEAKELANKSEKNAELWRDELSNAKNLIKDLKKKLAKGESLEASEALEKELAAEKAKTSELQTKITELETRLEELKAISQDDTVVKLQMFQGENKNLKARIEAALANLEGRTVPTAEELAAIRPDFPLWYTGMLILMIIVGVAGGIGWMDYQNRRRHGGFRL